MAKAGLKAILLLLLILGIPGCAAKTSAEQAGIDQEITRNIMWRFRQDSLRRFIDVRVNCEDREILIEGRVSDAGSARDALQIAMANARGGKVVSKLEVRPR